MSTLLAFACLLSLVAIPVCLLIFIIKAIRKKPKKKWAIGSVAAVVIFFASVAMMPVCEHEWVEADCTSPRICALCEMTEGDALGHNWSAETCTTGKICSQCQMEEGNALGHDWLEATCESAKVCSRCGAEEGNALGHTWVDADCTTPQKCAVCSVTEGEALGHQFGEETITKEATCAEEGYAEGVCSVCGEVTGHEIPTIEHTMGKKTVTIKETCTEDGYTEQKCKNCEYICTEIIPKTGHTEGKWKVTEEATYSASGTKSVSCTKCSEILKTETYELNDAEKEEAFKKMCKKVKYEDLARYPEKYLLETVKYKGKVVQVVENDDEYILRVNVTKGSYGIYKDTVWVQYTRNDTDSGRILEDDIITFYGYSYETISYETVLGATVTIPAVLAIYIDY